MKAQAPKSNFGGGHTVAHVLYCGGGAQIPFAVVVGGKYWSSNGSPHLCYILYRKKSKNQMPGRGGGPSCPACFS